MSFRRSIAILLAAFVAACSDGPRESMSALPASPSAVTLTPTGRDFVAHPTVVGFPARAEGVEFRAQLENKYVGMGRRPAEVYVDAEGEAIWVGEYYRYRVNGCDHDTATQRTLSQIDGAPPGQICSLLAFPENAVYPPRDQVVDFRRQLGAKYQGMGRSAQSAVDPDGAAIWLGEYYRYRTSGCDHATATQKVMSQIDGNPAAPTCAIPCAYFAETPASVPGIGGTFSVQLIRTSGTCDWVAVSDAPWITLNSPRAGTDRGSSSYTVAPNTGAPRSGWVRFIYADGTTFFEVKQASPSHVLAFLLHDPAVSPTAPATECLLKTTSTICTLTAVTAMLPNPVTSYDWRVEYAYGGSKVRTQVGALPTFSFSESCGASAPEGSPVTLHVTLKATDSAGNSATVTAGEGLQPILHLRTFNCP
jgi:hypothetical protein